MRKMTLLPFCAGLVILLAGATRTADPVSPDAGLETPFVYNCFGCRSCFATSYWHATDNPSGDYSPPQHGCQLAGDCDTHGICGGDGEDTDEVALVDELESIRKALQSEGPQALKQVLNEASSRVAINKNRMAVQVTGCSDGIVAHFPLTEGHFAALLN